MHKIYRDLEGIPKRKYEGYLWESGEKKPKIVRGENDLIVSEVKLNGYIIEGLLYCKEHKTSVHISHNGQYQIHEYNLEEVKEENLVEVEYLPHRLDGVEKVCFKQLWIAEKDDNCETMEVMKMKAVVFTGFKNQ